MTLMERGFATVHWSIRFVVVWYSLRFFSPGIMFRRANNKEIKSTGNCPDFYFTLTSSEHLCIQRQNRFQTTHFYISFQCIPCMLCAVYTSTQWSTNNHWYILYVIILVPSSPRFSGENEIKFTKKKQPQPLHHSLHSRLLFITKQRESEFASLLQKWKKKWYY